MQPLTRPLTQVGEGRLRMTALTIPDLLGRVGEGQVRG